MKNSKKKIIVSLMGLTMGAALVGSVSGSVAWYQYSTRATATIEGVSAGSSRNLQVRIKGDADNKWRNNITVDELNAAFGVTAAGATQLALRPATIHTATASTAPTYDADKALSETSSTLDFKKQPETRREAFTKITSQTEGTGTSTSFYYVQTTLQFRVVDNGSTTANAIKDIYLVDAEVTGDEKIESALRFHLTDGSNNHVLFANTATLTNVSGALDINGNDKVDTNGWAEDDSTGYIYNYCNESKTGDSFEELDGAGPAKKLKDEVILKQASYALSDGTHQLEGTDKLIADDTDIRTFVGGKKLGTTKAATDSFLELTLTIWLEGWDKGVDLQANSASTAIWDPTKNIAQDFSASFRFACNAKEGND